MTDTRDPQAMVRAQILSLMGGALSADEIVESIGNLYPGIFTSAEIMATITYWRPRLQQGEQEPVATEEPGRKRGRPPVFKPEFVEQAEKLAALGATDKEIAAFFKVKERTLYRWINSNPDFCQALKVGKHAPDERVVRSLYRRAVGYSFGAVKIMQYQGEEVVVPFTEHVPPDTTACIFWLKNRRREEWRDKIDHEHGGTLNIRRVVFGEPEPDPTT